MNCRDSESLILAERDGLLDNDQRAALSAHAATCPACAKHRARVTAALDDYRKALHTVPTPDADEAWRELQTRIHAPARRPRSPEIRFIAPVAAIAAAAALAVALITQRPGDNPASPTIGMAVAKALSAPLHDPSFIAGADFVEAGDPDASVVVFVDQESGWLVVWATKADGPAQG